MDSASAEPRMIGSITQIWRYPVKSMGGELLSAADVSERGIAGDRLLAVLDVTAGKILSAKKESRLLSASARIRDRDDVRVTLPEHGEFEADDPRLHSALSAWLGRECRLVRPVPGVSAVFEKRDADDENLVKDLTTRPGLFFDTKSTLHVLTTSSLESARRLYPEGDWDVRRFRPNILVETEDEGFPEESWPGTTIALGAASAWVRKATPRCAMTGRAQASLPQDREIHRTLARRHGNVLGVLAHPAGDACLRIGDLVSRQPAAADARVGALLPTDPFRD
ncbi:MOSC domain-containing protein [Streptomyces halobius]|uniref:MOSC N-terminal beta barrel domain-containing protein n=1 Tax=Streptomyces halobius TaxID=2879846 RepID=A0ABY4MAZ1_9ACTN|nr:MOSC N-terminal beta barrel domain-containing protein [Streptomyces halobius]UQA94853.1 MOSC N-terminal beta barrel domain-containing protein [Streptomyces halobius]